MIIYLIIFFGLQGLGSVEWCGSTRRFSSNVRKWF